VSSSAITSAPVSSAAALAAGPRLGRATLRSIGWLLVVAVLVAVVVEGLVGSSLGPTAGDAVRIGRNIAYLVLAPLLLVYVLLTGRIRAFLLPVDLAFAALTSVLIVGSLAADSSVSLTAEGVFVYLRGVIIFYGIRALRPDWASARRLAWLLGAIFVLNAVVAMIQVFVGLPAFTVFGYADLTWAVINRSQGLQVHPNHLGHILGIGALGALGVIAAVPGFARRWWLLFALFAYAIAASQSRETVLGVVAGLAVLIVVRRAAVKRLIAGGLLLAAFVATIWVAHPANFAELSRRLAGVLTALQIPSGQEQGVICDPTIEACTIDGLPHREVRVLYMQQGFALWARQPVFGYGIGQFGGNVAYEDDPKWYDDPRFGPDGFDMHGFQAKQVDSFWLHLLVETGTVGVVAYGLWFVLLGWPLARSSLARRRSMSNAGRVDLALALPPAALAALAFAVVIAIFSPSLEDPMFPPLMFALLGFAWLAHRDELASALPAPVATPEAT
jgi:hypothetical protein